VLRRIRLRSTSQEGHKRVVGEKTKIEFLPGEQSEALVVPISALFTGTNGDTDVVVVENGVEKQVTVTMGAGAAGFVEITPTAEGAVTAGDQVLVSEPAQ
jgi:multidrug efflux pump subunit AcrA (membrane-fusion protein)